MSDERKEVTVTYQDGESDAEFHLAREQALTKAQTFVLAEFGRVIRELALERDVEHKNACAWILEGRGLRNALDAEKRQHEETKHSLDHAIKNMAEFQAQLKQKRSRRK